jgi:hypothetical protein
MGTSIPIKVLPGRDGFVSDFLIVPIGLHLQAFYVEQLSTAPAYERERTPIGTGCRCILIFPSASG